MDQQLTAYAAALGVIMPVIVAFVVQSRWRKRTKRIAAMVACLCRGRRGRPGGRRGSEGSCDSDTGDARRQSSHLPRLLEADRAAAGAGANDRCGRAQRAPKGRPGRRSASRREAVWHVDRDAVGDAHLDEGRASVLLTAIAQLRFALALATGRPIPVRALERLTADAAATVREFGAVGPDGQEAVAGPTLDEATRRDVQLRRFRTQAKRAAAETPTTRRSSPSWAWTRPGWSWSDVARLPLTPKEALREDAGRLRPPRRRRSPCGRPRPAPPAPRPASASPPASCGR